jgi:hypothetical protein
MGFGTHMIAGSPACSIPSPTHSPDHHQPVKPALCRGRVGLVQRRAVMCWIWMVRGEGNGTTER